VADTPCVRRGLLALGRSPALEEPSRWFVRLDAKSVDVSGDLPVGGRVSTHSRTKRGFDIVRWRRALRSILPPPEPVPRKSHDQSAELGGGVALFACEDSEARKRTMPQTRGRPSPREARPARRAEVVLSSASVGSREPGTRPRANREQKTVWGVA